jgi:Sensors of blue-light using FAD
MPYQLMYSSQAAQPMTVDGLAEILADARNGNEARNVTGALVHVDGVFFQILEGDKDVVKSLMQSIARDTRHHSVKVFYDGEVGARAFQNWRMAYLSASAGQMSQWAGLPGTVSVKELLADIDRNPQRVPGILVSILKSIA